MGFREGHIEGEKVFNGTVFPKTLLPPAGCLQKCNSTTSDLVEMVKAEHGSLVDALRQHGAILFRGFDVSSAEDFSAVVDAFGWDEFQYQGSANRVKLADRVYTPNSIPLDEMIPFHHEMAIMKQSPSKIFFFCLQPPPEGGQTSIVPSNVVVEKLEEKVPQVVAKLEQDGIKLIRHTKLIDNEDTDYAKQTVWHQLLINTKDEEAHKRALEKPGYSSAKFNSDGSADFVFGPLNPIRELEGKRVLFHRILDMEFEEKDMHINIHVTFGEGTPLPLEAINACNDILAENCVDVGWQKGDVMLVDNFRVQHARRAGKPPRVVLVSLTH